MVASDIEQPTGTHASRPAVHFSPSRVLFLSPTAAPGSYAPDDDQRSELTPGPLLPTAGSSDAGWVGEMAAAGASRNAVSADFSHQRGLYERPPQIEIVCCGRSRSPQRRRPAPSRTYFAV
jgi:hypothetical protein